jgi:hypothetical protein
MMEYHPRWFRRFVIGTWVFAALVFAFVAVAIFADAGGGEGWLSTAMAGWYSVMAGLIADWTSSGKIWWALAGGLTAACGFHLLMKALRPAAKAPWRIRNTALLMALVGFALAAGVGMAGAVLRTTELVQADGIYLDEYPQVLEFESAVNCALDLARRHSTLEAWRKEWVSARLRGRLAIDKYATHLVLNGQGQIVQIFLWSRSRVLMEDFGIWIVESDGVPFQRASHQFQSELASSKDLVKLNLLKPIAPDVTAAR